MFQETGLPHAKKRNLLSDVDLQLFKKATRWIMVLILSKVRVVGVAAALPLRHHWVFFY